MVSQYFTAEMIMAPRREKITIEVDRETREGLSRLAQDEDRSFASFVRRTLDAYVARRQRKASPRKRAA
jgi:predicted transcriptional regulator